MYSTKRINHRLAEGYLNVPCEYKDLIKKAPDSRVKGKQFQTVHNATVFKKFDYAPDPFTDSDGFLKSQPTRVKGFGSGDAHRVSEFTQDFKVKQHRETLKKEDGHAFESLEKEISKWGTESKTRAEGFLYDRATDSSASEPCTKCHRETHHCKHRSSGERRLGRLEHTSLADIGHKVSDPSWWERKEHGAKSITSSFNDSGHLKI